MKVATRYNNYKQIILFLHSCKVFSFLLYMYVYIYNELVQHNIFSSIGPHPNCSHPRNIKEHIPLFLGGVQVHTTSSIPAVSAEDCFIRFKSFTVKRKYIR